MPKPKTIVRTARKKFTMFLMVLIAFAFAALNATVAVAQTDDVIGYGSAVTGEIATRAGDEWFFSGCEGDIVTIEMHSDELDSYLELYDPTSRRPIAEDDNSAGAEDARIEEIELADSGVYSIVAAGATRRDRGEYSLVLASDIISDTSETSEAPTLDYGEIVDGEVATIRGEEWTFWGCADDLVTLSMESDEFAGYLELYAPDARRPMAEIGVEDNEIALEISDILLPESGIYTVVVAGEGRRDRGPYSLALLVDEGETNDVELALASAAEASSAPKSAKVSTSTPVPPTPTQVPPTSTPVRPTSTPVPPTSTPTPHVAEPSPPVANPSQLPAPMAMGYHYPAFKWHWESMPTMQNVDNWYFDVKIFNNEFSEYPYDIKVAEVANVAADGPNEWRYVKQTDFRCGSYWAIQIAKRNPDGSYAGPMSPESNRVPTNQGCSKSGAGTSGGGGDGGGDGGGGDGDPGDCQGCG